MLGVHWGAASPPRQRHLTRGTQRSRRTAFLVATASTHHVNGTAFIHEEHEGPRRGASRGPSLPATATASHTGNTEITENGLSSGHRLHTPPTPTAVSPPFDSARDRRIGTDEHGGTRLWGGDFGVRSSMFGASVGPASQPARSRWRKGTTAGQVGVRRTGRAWRLWCGRSPSTLDLGLSTRRSGYLTKIMVWDRVSSPALMV
jgi:hypothetical protein